VRASFLEKRTIRRRLPSVAAGLEFELTTLRRRQTTLRRRSDDGRLRAWRHLSKEVAIAIPSQTVGSPSREIRRQVACGRALSIRERDRLLYELLVRYRRGDRAYWGALILELLDPAIKIRVSRFRPEGPTMTIEDLYQDLVCALLEDALSIPLDGPAYLTRRLVLRSGFRVTRALRREARYQEVLEPIEVWAEEHENGYDGEEDQ
jgi:hypothetical protein